jgi:chromosome segregation ATPase
MIFGMIKKTIGAGVLGVLALVGLFGTPAGSYVRTGVTKIRTVAKDSVPVQFEIDRAKHEIEQLDPAIRQHIEILARAEQDVKRLEAEIAETTANLDKQKTAILKIRASVGDSVIRPVSDSKDGMKLEEMLRNKLDGYNRVERILSEKKATLESRQKVVESAKEHLTAIATQKKALEARVEEIQARLAAIEANNARNKYHFDGSALSRAKKSVNDLDERLTVITRVAEMEGRLEEDGTLAPAKTAIGDVTKEIDAKFGAKAKENLAGEASASL